MQSPDRLSGSSGEPAEHRESSCDRELLARDSVEQALKDAREAGRLEAAVALGELSEQRVAGGTPVETRKVEVDPEQTRQRRARGSLGGTRRVAPCQDNLEPRCARCTDLRHRHFQGSAVEMQCTRYVRPSQVSIAFWSLLRSAQTVRSSRNGGRGRSSSSRLVEPPERIGVAAVSARPSPRR